MSEPMILTYDYETTGVDPNKDRPVQIGLTAGVETPRVCMNALCDPCQPIDPGASKVHGITNEVVRGHPDYLVGIYTMVTLIEHMGKGLEVIIAGYNHERYDNAITEACLKVALGNSYLQLDILRLLYRHYPRLSSHKLEGAHQELLGRELVGAHGAVQDCLGSMAILSFVTEDLKKSPKQLAVELQTPQVFSVMPIGKFKGYHPDEVEIGWAQYMDRKAKDMNLDLKATVDYILQR